MKYLSLLLLLAACAQNNENGVQSPALGTWSTGNYKLTLSPNGRFGLDGVTCNASGAYFITDQAFTLAFTNDTCQEKLVGTICEWHIDGQYSWLYCDGSHVIMRENDWKKIN